MNDIELFTTSYRAFSPEWGLPVRTSNGHPKYGINYKLQYKAPLLYPEWAMVKADLPMEQFNRRYEELMDERGIDNIKDMFQALADHSGENRLVLMCFEKSPSHCHRRAFASWWMKRTGEPVLELPS